MTGTAVVTGVGVVTPPAGAAADWFDPRTALGPRGYKYLPPACQYLLAAGRLAVADGGRVDGVPPERRAAFLATNTGLERLFTDMDAAVTGGTADALSPSLAPFFAVNVLGTRLVTEHTVNGPFLTLTSPRVAGIEAIGAGARTMAAGRCDAWIAATMEDPVDAPASGGAVVLILEDPAAAAARGARVHGTCRATTLLAPPSVLRSADGRRHLAEAVRGLLRADPHDDLAAGSAGRFATGVEVELFGDGSATEDAVLAALALVPGAVVRREPAGPGCLAPVRRLAALLTDPGRTRARLVLTVTDEGHIGAARMTTAQPTAGSTG